MLEHGWPRPLEDRLALRLNRMAARACRSSDRRPFRFLRLRGDGARITQLGIASVQTYLPDWLASSCIFLVNLANGAEKIEPKCFVNEAPKAPVPNWFKFACER